MVESNNRFSNPVIKDEIEILFESDEKLIFTTFLKPNGGQSGVHYHAKITEKFTIIEGELNVIVNTIESVLKPNSELVINPLDRHQFVNKSGNNVIFVVEITPSIQIKKGLQIIYGLAQDGKVYKNGLPTNIFYMAIAIKMMDAYVPHLPLFIQKIGILSLAFISRITGLDKKIVRKYCY